VLLSHLEYQLKKLEIKTGIGLQAREVIGALDLGAVVREKNLAHVQMSAADAQDNFCS
jgi:hypothetical protein